MEKLKSRVDIDSVRNLIFNSGSDDLKQPGFERKRGRPRKRWAQEVQNAICNLANDR